MLTEIYIEALLIDEEQADQIWEAWDKGEIDDNGAYCTWWGVGMAERNIAEEILGGGAEIWSPFR